MLLAPIIIPIMSSGGGHMSTKEGGICTLLTLTGLLIGTIYGFVKNDFENKLHSTIIGAIAGMTFGLFSVIILNLIYIASRLFV
jgi:hypothetical protein